MNRDNPIFSQADGLSGAITGVGGLPFTGLEAERFIMRTCPRFLYTPEPPGNSIFLPLTTTLPDLIVRDPQLWFDQQEFITERLQKCLINSTRFPTTAQALAIKTQIVGPITAMRYYFEPIVGELIYEDDYLELVLNWYKSYLRIMSAMLPCGISVRAVVFDEPAFFLAEMNTVRAERLQRICESIQNSAKNYSVSLGVHCCALESWHQRWSMLECFNPDILSVPLKSVLSGQMSDWLCRSPRIFVFGVVDPETRTTREKTSSQINLSEKSLRQLQSQLAEKLSSVEGCICWSPSCGLGLQSEKRAELVFHMVEQFSLDIGKIA